MPKPRKSDPEEGKKEEEEKKKKRQYGTGSYRLRGNKYYIRYYHPITREKVEEPTTETTESGAKAALKRKIAELEVKYSTRHKVSRTVASNITVMDIVDKYANHRRDKVRSKENLPPLANVALGSDDSIIDKSLRPFFEKVKWYEFDTFHATTYRKERRLQLCKNGNNAKAGTARGRRSHVKHGTIDRELRVLRAAVNHLVKEGDPLARLVSIKFENENDVRTGFVTPSQFLSKLYVALNKPSRRHIRDLIAVLFCTGARVSELKRLRWVEVYMDDANPDKWSILIAKSKIEEQREVPIFAGLMREIFMALKSRANPEVNEFVFPSIKEDAKHVKSFVRAWRSAVREAGTRSGDGSWLRPHDLRRSAARNMRNAGLTAEAVMAFMGHKTHDMLLRYNIISAEELRIGRERMNVTAAEWSKYQVA